MARCEEWAAKTGVYHTILGLALTGHGAFLTRLIEKEVTTESYKRASDALDQLIHLDKLAGAFVLRSRSGGRGDDARAAKETLRERAEHLGAAVGVRSALIALAVTHDSTLLHERGGVSPAQFHTYSVRLDRIEASLITANTMTGEQDGESAAGEEAGEASAGHRDEGVAVHRALREAR